MSNFQFVTVIYNNRTRITHTLWNLLCLSLTAAYQRTAWFDIIFLKKVNLNTILNQLARYQSVSVLQLHVCMHAHVHTHIRIHTQTRQAMHYNIILWHVHIIIVAVEKQQSILCFVHIMSQMASLLGRRNTEDKMCLLIFSIAFV